MEMSQRSIFDIKFYQNLRFFWENGKKVSFWQKLSFWHFVAKVFKNKA